MRSKRHNQITSRPILDLDKRVRVRSLSNGMKVLICEIAMCRNLMPSQCLKPVLDMSRKLITD